MAENSKIQWTTHDPTRMVYFCRSNQKHAHNTKHGVKYRSHWFSVYKCPTCGRTASRKRQPIICRGYKPEENSGR